MGNVNTLQLRSRWKRPNIILQLGNIAALELLTKVFPTQQCNKSASRVRTPGHR
jgi:hypothetical protein